MAAQRCDGAVYIDGQDVVFAGICEGVDEAVYYGRFDLDCLMEIQ